MFSEENEELNLKVVSTRKHFSQQPQNDLEQVYEKQRQKNEEISF